MTTDTKAPETQDTPSAAKQNSDTDANVNADVNGNGGGLSSGELRPIAEALGCSIDEVQELCRLFSKTPTELPDLMSSLDWSADKILEFGSSVAPAYMAIKFQFAATRKVGSSGALCVIVDGRNGGIIDETYCVQAGMFDESMQPSMNWEDYRRGVMALSPTSDRRDIPTIRKLFRTIFSPSALRKMFADKSGVFAKELEVRLRKDVDINFVNCNLSALHVERFSVARLKLGGFEAETPDVQTEKNAPQEKPEIVCRAVVDPMYGKASYDLQFGERIWVELVDGPGLNGVVYRLFAYLRADPVFPVKAIEPTPTGTVAVKFDISDEVCGVITVVPDLRIKVFDPNFKKGGFGFWIAIVGFIFGLGIALVAAHYML